MYVFMVLAENLTNSLEENYCIRSGISKRTQYIFPTAIFTIFIAWFKFHNISGSAKKWWLISSRRHAIAPTTRTPFTHRLRCCKLILFHEQCMNSLSMIMKMLYKRHYTSDSDYEWLTSPPIFLSNVCQNMSSWISRQSFGPINKFGFDLQWSRANMD